MARQRTRRIQIFLGTLLLAVILKFVHWYYKDDNLIDGEFLFNAPTSAPVATSKKIKQAKTASSLFGRLECDRSGQTCAFQNLVYEDGEYRIYLKRKGFSRYAGILLAEGIGSPSTYYYINSWSKWSPHERLTRIEKATREEIDRMDPRPIPIYLCPLTKKEEASKKLKIRRLDGLTVQIAVLWPENFFRIFYAFGAAWTTLSRWDLTVMRPLRLNLADDLSLMRRPPMELIMKAIPGTFGGKPSAKDSVCYERAVIGISPHAWLDEIGFYVDSTGLADRMKGFQDFAARLKRVYLPPQQLSDNLPPLILFIGRQAGSRRILNMSELMRQTLMHFGNQVRIKMVYFELLSIREQMELIQKAHVVVAVHGAALTHILWMRKGSYVMEIFPFGFKKSIYRDLARCMGIHYLSYQVPRPEAVRFLKEIDDDGKKVAIRRGEPDWICYQGEPDCLRQKEWWRSQDITVDPASFLAHLKTIAPLDRPAYATDRFLIFMPWEQFGNQVIEFKSACATAKALNRTLVLPPVGFWDPRKAEGFTVERRRWYNPRHYNWRPIERYFEGFEQLPCATVPWDAFTNLVSHVDSLMFRATHNDPTQCRQRTEWFYYEEAAMKWSSPPQVFYAIQVKPEDLATRKAFQMPRVLAMGNVFMMAQMGPWIRFPVTRYTDLAAESPLYAQMILPFRKELRHLSWVLLNCPKSPLRGPFDAAHIRRGDYRDKCVDDAKSGNFANLRQFVSCWQPDRYLEKRLSSPKRPLYIATNSPPEAMPSIERPAVVFLRDLKSVLRASIPSEKVFADDLRRAWKTMIWMDPIESAIVDQLICAAAYRFTGNLYSSFTRAIIDQIHRAKGSTRHSFF